ncbi:interleukine-1 receptor-associated kinase-a [Elysia marginata]|uniref:Interleukine-1 receptor-associated kinase-a n=1 Tax=Elysia marginata TaxID=1093978 RepID=A0AAV4FDA2_9GAST|nr:interleukine-1 receptor-associated kinase-a [Elysia marginata]
MYSLNKGKTMSSSQWGSLSSGSKTKAKDSIANKSLCEIDYSVTLALIRNMDCDNGWIELASKCQYIAQQIFRLKEMRYKPNGSPTDTLLWELGCEGYKVKDLYEKLKEIRRLREVEILEEYGNVSDF